MTQYQCYLCYSFIRGSTLGKPFTRHVLFLLWNEWQDRKHPQVIDCRFFVWGAYGAVMERLTIKYLLLVQDQTASSRYRFSPRRSKISSILQTCIWNAPASPPVPLCWRLCNVSDSRMWLVSSLWFSTSWVQWTRMKRIVFLCVDLVH